MDFVLISKRYWKATDRADQYEIFGKTGKYGGFYGFKNEAIPLCQTKKLEDAIAACHAEQQTQEWFSYNPENAEKNAHYRAIRETNRIPKKPKRKRPHLYKGK